MQIQGNPKITIVQGDSYTREILFEQLYYDLIESVFFSSNKLAVCKKLLKDETNNIFVLHLESNETKNYPIGTYDYDLTIKFINEDIKTAQYQSIISILEKNNKVICYE